MTSERIIERVLDTIDRNIHERTIEDNQFDNEKIWDVNMANLKSQLAYILRDYKSTIISECNNYDPNNTYEHPNNMQHD